MPPSLLAPLHSTPIAVVDVETTGASAGTGHRVTEVGILRVEPGGAFTRYQQLVDPQRPISPGVIALTGITQAMVRGQPTFGDQLGPMLGLLRGAAVVGHNVRFDLGFLAAECGRAGVDLAGELGKAPVFDTVRLARSLFGRGGNSLQPLSRRLGVPASTAHRALADAETTFAVFDKMIAPLGGWALTVLDVIQRQGGPIPVGAASPARAGRAAGLPFDGELPFELAEALEERRPVRMEYLDAGNRRTERLIDPIRVRHAGGVGTLVAHCHLRGAQRTFKLDRIVRFVKADGP